MGGPNQDDSYFDQRFQHVINEVSCDYNAGFQGAIAGEDQLLSNEHTIYLILIDPF